MIIKPSQVYVANRHERSHRRIVAVFGDYVYYSDGGDTNKACLIRTFVRWVMAVNSSMLIEGAH